MDFLDNSSRNLTQQVTHALGRAIVQGKYDRNGALPTEADLSAEFNTSRSVTREAVKMLTAKGLITSRPRQGITIQPKNNWNLFDSDVLGWLSSAQPSAALIQEFNQMRWAIEPEAVVLAARLGIPEYVKAIADALVDIEHNNKPASWRQRLAAETAFHTAVLSASGNRFFGQFSDFVQTALHAASSFHSETGHIQDNVALYRRIYQAILQGRQQEGRTAMLELLGVQPQNA